MALEHVKKKYVYLHYKIQVVANLKNIKYLIFKKKFEEIKKEHWRLNTSYQNIL